MSDLHPLSFGRALSEHGRVEALERQVAELQQRVGALETALALEAAGRGSRARSQPENAA